MSHLGHGGLQASLASEEVLDRCWRRGRQHDEHVCGHVVVVVVAGSRRGTTTASCTSSSWGRRLVGWRRLNRWQQWRDEVHQRFC
jgi:hypothetical protein